MASGNYIKTCPKGHKHDWANAETDPPGTFVIYPCERACGICNKTGNFASAGKIRTHVQSVHQITPAAGFTGSRASHKMWALKEGKRVSMPAEDDEDRGGATGNREVEEGSSEKKPRSKYVYTTQPRDSSPSLTLNLHSASSVLEREAPASLDQPLVAPAFEEFAAREIHIDFAQRAIFDSPLVSVFCGPHKKVVFVHRNLITLHSQYFQDKLNSVAEDGDCKIYLPQISPEHFANYHSWMLWRKVLFVYPEDSNSFDTLWKIGQTLGDGQFQNWVMDQIRESVKNNPTQWLSIDNVATRYTNTAEGCTLRELTAHCLACNNPFHTENLEVQKSWTKLLGRFPDLNIDIHKAGAKNWNGTQPWDDEHRMSWMVQDVVPLEQRMQKEDLVG